MHPVIYPDSAEFGRRLREAFTQKELTDPAEIGRRLAAEQTLSYRGAMPYAAEYIEAWFNGFAMPDGTTFETIDTMLGHPQGLADAYELATYDPRQTTEESFYLLSRMRRAGLNYRQLGERLQEEGIQGRDGKILTAGYLCNWIRGKPIPLASIAALDRIMPPREDEIPLMTLQQWHDDLLKTAEQMPTLRQALTCIRRAMRFTAITMAKELSEELPEGVTMSVATVRGWEKGQLPVKFQKTDLITAYCNVLERHGVGEWARANESHWRDLLTKAIKGAGRSDYKLYQYASGHEESNER